MNNNNFVYTDLLVKNLIHISELNVQINGWLNSIDKNNQKFIELENNLKSEILFDFVNCLNVTIRMKDARKFALGMNKSPENMKERLLLNTRNVIDYINASYNSEKFGLGFLVHVNRLFLDEIKDVWDIGKMIQRKEDIDISFDFYEKEKTINQTDVVDFVRSIDEQYLMLSEILKSSITFYTLIRTNIFACGNDAVALASLMFLFKKEGFNKYINFNSCIQNILKSKNSEEDDLNSFLGMFFNELANELREIKSKLLPFAEEANIQLTKYVDLNLRQIKGLSYIKEQGRISREIYSRLNNVSHITAYRDLSNLLQKGYVRVEGIGKGTKYISN